VIGAAALLLAAIMPTTDPALVQARDMLRKTVLVDGHNDLPWAIREATGAPGNAEAYDLRRRTSGQTDLARLREGGVGAQFWSVYVSGDAEYKKAGYARTQLEQIDIARRVIALYPDHFEAAFSADDVQKAFARGRIASLLGMEGGHVLENSMGALRAYYDLGARYLTLTHNVTTDWADSCNDDPKHDGLSPFGEEVVREMNRLGMLVDLSHAAPATMDDAIRVSEAPVVFTHSNARAVADVPRNVPDAILKRLPANGGVVMVTFVAGFVSKAVSDVTRPAQREYRRRVRGIKDRAQRARIEKEVLGGLKVPAVTIDDVIRHIEHVRKVAGLDHVGIGGDFDGSRLFPTGLEDVSTYPNLFAELIRRGWSEADLKKLAGENVLRALRQAEEVSKRLRASRKPSTATIHSLRSE
jgi:membrane dipeptidase